MDGTKFFLGIGTAAITYFRLGFCPAKVKIVGLTEEDVMEWYLPLAASAAIETVDSTGVRTLGSDGIKLCTFNDPVSNSLPGAGGAPTLLEPAEFWKANGIQITAGILAIADGVPYIVEATPFSFPIVRAVHDGGDASHLYCQDSSVDFKDAGISGGQSWILFNVTNDNYAYIKGVEKPSGQRKHCRLTVAVDASGTATAAADFDDDDVILCVPKNVVQYPLSGVGLMS